jgi:hypothetical protein
MSREWSFLEKVAYPILNGNTNKVIPILVDDICKLLLRTALTVATYAVLA